MILEIAELKVKPGLQEEFLRNVQKGVDIFRQAKGCRAMELRESPEAPNEFRLLVIWETIENHVVDFRGSPEFATWRTLTLHCYAEPPVIKNWSVAVSGFGFSGNA